MDLRKVKKRKTGPNKTTGLNKYLVLGTASVAFCWFYGLPPLVLAWLSLRRLLPMRKSSGSLKPARLAKFRWALRISWAGLVMSLFFFVIYFISLIEGAYITY